jgi:hypothetical protein
VATSVFAAVPQKALPLAGSYLADCNAKQPRADAEDAALASRLWLETGRLVERIGAERTAARPDPREGPRLP